jgi:protein-S-isoprenylcysteine O-methyltransferase Ste14
MKDIPGILLVASIWAYWIGVGIMIARVRSRTPKLAGLVPEQRLEKYLWLIWVPLVVAWIVLPYLALLRPPSAVLFPQLVRGSSGYASLRWLAAACAVASLLLTSLCWSRMGRNWRLDVSTRNVGELITDGPFSYVRHPIYSLQRLHVLCSLVVVPTWPMLGIAVVHFCLTQIKARNEERYLMGAYADAYRDYAARTGMFLPRPRHPSSRGAGRTFAVPWAFIAVLLAPCVLDADAQQGPPLQAPPVRVNLDRMTEERILALKPEHITDDQVRTVLARAPAPRIIDLQGSVAVVTMAPFAEFLIAMGYPEERVRNPRDGTLSYSSFVDSAELAGALAWYYEQEGMMPMLIGHSQGGMMAIKVLHELAGDFGDRLTVWNPLRNEAEARTSIIDPMSGAQRPIIGLKVPYAAALATGMLPRIMLGQWNMIERLREIPDTVVEFSGYSLDWDLIAGNFGHSEPYRAMGSAKVRNVTLPPSAGHINLPLVLPFASDPITRAWISNYSPSQPRPPLPSVPGVDLSNLLHAADIWYSVKKHWCLEAQKLIRARLGDNVAKSAGG